MSGLFDTGFWRVGRVMGVPIGLHWSLPVGAVVFGHFRFVPGFWLGFFLLVLVHEIGHAFLVKRRGLRNREIRVHGLGGVSIHERGTLYDQAIIAWGGVLAQLLVLYVPTVILVNVVELPSLPFLQQLVSAFLFTNLLLAAFNLIPIAPLDGHLAWKLPRLWRTRRRGHRPRKQKTPRADRGGSRKRPRDWSRGGEAAQPLRTAEEEARLSAREIARRALEDARRDS